MVRAARQFQESLWIADQSPGLAWLVLVGALETAATQQAGEEPALNALRAMRPKWAEVLESSAHPDREDVIEQIPELSASARKVRDLVKAHKPPPPKRRPTAPHAIRWTKAVSLVNDIYGLRSNAVHSGLPLPAPMLEAPIPRMDPPAERPGGTIGSGDSIWTENDMPMYLHTFAFIVGAVLRSWWASLDPD